MLAVWRIRALESRCIRVTCVCRERVSVRVYVCVGCRAHLQRTWCVLQPLFGAAAVLPPTRFCRESYAYCTCKATLLARTCHFPFSKSILAPCAPPVQSTTSTLLRPGPYTFHRAPLCCPVSSSANIYASIVRALARK